MKPGETAVLFDREGPGAVRHWWLTYRLKKTGFTSKGKLQLRVVADERTTIDQPFDPFFCVMCGEDISPIDSLPIQVLPRNGFNSYLPMPFDTNLRMELVNTSGEIVDLWFMADWQRFPDGTHLTPLRLETVYRKETPAELAGNYLMADFSGSGYVVGFAKGLVLHDRTDSWYHTGGDLWLLDGEDDPHLMHGIGSEDVFGFSFGVAEQCAPFVGAPVNRRFKNPDEHEENELVSLYRWFVPDPIRFDTSCLFLFGSRANDTESTVFAYRDPDSEAPQISTISKWNACGPFECATWEQFLQSEFPETDANKGQTFELDFGQYKDKGCLGGWRELESARGFVDLNPAFRAPGTGNIGLLAGNVSAYLEGDFEIETSGPHVLRVGFDDWARIWLNGEHIADARHDNGFEVTKFRALMKTGKNHLRIKLSNFNNTNFRAWVLHLDLA